MTLRLLFWHEKHEELAIKTRRCYDFNNTTLQICKPLVIYIFKCMALYTSQVRRHVINNFTDSYEVS